jgi:hypothetical protein
MPFFAPAKRIFHAGHPIFEQGSVFVTERGSVDADLLHCHTFHVIGTFVVNKPHFLQA